MRRIAIACLMVSIPAVVHANDWEKFYRPAPVGTTPILPSDQPPQVVDLPPDPSDLVNSMWRKGFALIGASSFNSTNASTKDAIRFALKLKAAYIGVASQLASSQTSSIPFTTPTASTSYTNGTVSATGTGGSASGTYSGTTTTYGSQTTYIPITINRFEKVALYFGSIAKKGAGLLLREPTTEEVARFETRHLLIVRSVREGSAADAANVLDGDTILTINGQAATAESFRAAATSGNLMALHLIRNGQQRDLSLTLE